MYLTHFEKRFLYACEKGNIESIKETLPFIDSVNFENEKAEHPLKMAVIYNSVDIIKLLIDNFVIVNWIDNQEQSVLKYIKSVDVLNLLNDHGLDIHYHEKKLNSPLYYMYINNQLDVASQLLFLGVQCLHLQFPETKQGNKRKKSQFCDLFKTFKEKQMFEHSVEEKNTILNTNKI